MIWRSVVGLRVVAWSDILANGIRTQRTNPTPSEVDKSGWIKLANKRQDGRPVLAVIVGRKGLHVELVDCEGKAMVMHAELE
jgi:hypothetical protein